MKSHQNLFQDIPTHLSEELLQTLVENTHVRIERIVSRGHQSPEGFWYDQQQHEFVLLVQGEAELALQSPDEQIRLCAGDWLVINAHRKHRVDWTDPQHDTIWLTVFF